jgi:UDPglucose--hexose-1-phosphate uridylyltransferase
VIIAPNRGNRPNLGQTFQPEEKKAWTCPFCPDAPEGAGKWVVKQLSNRFASLDENAPPFTEEIIGDIYKLSSNFGKCEVILYSQDHNASFGKLEHDNIVALIKLWMERFKVLSGYPGIKYPFLFENRGKEIGVSQAHPHGQIYAFPYLPPKIEREFNAIKDYKLEKDRCLMCDVVALERKAKERIIDENKSFVSFIPQYAHWPFEINIVPKRHFSSIDQCMPSEIQDLATIMKQTVLRYDTLRGDDEMMPYIMAMHNCPVKTPDTEVWHYHIEFYTPYRGKDRLKYLGGVETGTNTFINDSLPEVNAKTLRELQIE